jgi:hypothetical protein
MNGTKLLNTEIKLMIGHEKTSYTKPLI